MKLHPVLVLRQPRLSRIVEPVARPIIDDQKDLPRAIRSHQIHQKQMEGMPVEHVDESVREGRVVRGDRPNHVRGLAFAKGIYARLDTHRRPGLMQRAVEPEARLVLE